MPFFQDLDDQADITDITFSDRRRFAPMDKFTQTLMRGSSPLSVAERELIAAFVSGTNNCTYCHGIHAAVARQFGISEVLLKDLLEDFERADVSEKMRPLLAYVRKLTLTPSRMLMQDAQAVFDAGWEEQALRDAICVCGLFNYYNRLLDGHGLKGSEGIYNFGANHLTKRGYGVPWFIKYIKGFIRRSKLKQIAQDN